MAMVVEMVLYVTVGMGSGKSVKIVLEAMEMMMAMIAVLRSELWLS